MAKQLKCRVCGKKRELDDEGMCGKCQDAAGAEQDVQDEEVPPNLVKEIERQIAREEIEAQLKGGKVEVKVAKQPEPTMFGPTIGLPEIPPSLANRFHKRMKKDEVVPFTSSLVGIATTPEARAKVIALARTGQRLIRIETKKVKDAVLYGVYVS